MSSYNNPNDLHNSIIEHLTDISGIFIARTNSQIIEFFFFID